MYLKCIAGVLQVCIAGVSQVCFRCTATCTLSHSSIAGEFNSVWKVIVCVSDDLNFVKFKTQFLSRALPLHLWYWKWFWWINIPIFSVEFFRLNNKYFVADGSDSSEPGNLKITAWEPYVNLLEVGDIVPLYSEQGEFVLFIGDLFDPYIPIQEKLQGTHWHVSMVSSSNLIMSTLQSWSRLLQFLTKELDQSHVQQIWRLGNF